MCLFFREKIKTIGEIKVIRPFVTNSLKEGSNKKYIMALMKRFVFVDKSEGFHFQVPVAIPYEVGVDEQYLFFNGTPCAKRGANKNAGVTPVELRNMIEDGDVIRTLSMLPDSDSEYALVLLKPKTNTGETVDYNRRNLLHVQIPRVSYERTWPYGESLDVAVPEHVFTFFRNYLNK